MVRLFFFPLLLLTACSVPVTRSESVNLSYAHYSDSGVSSAQKNNQAADLILKGRTEEAVTLLVSLIQEDRAAGKKTNPETFLNLSGVYFQARDTEKIGKLWRIALSPGMLTDAQITDAAHQLESRGRNYEYAVLLEESLKAGRNSETAARELAYLAERTGSNEDAVKAWLHYLLSSENKAEGYSALSLLFIKEKKYSESYYFLNLYNYLKKKPETCGITADSYNKSWAYDREVRSLQASFYPADKDLSVFRYRAYEALSHYSGEDKDKIIFNLLLQHYREGEAREVMKKNRNILIPPGNPQGQETLHRSLLSILNQCDPSSSDTDIALKKGNLILKENPEADLSNLRGGRSDEEWNGMLDVWYGSWRITPELRKAVRTEFQLLY